MNRRHLAKAISLILALVLLLQPLAAFAAKSSGDSKVDLRERIAKVQAARQRKVTQEERQVAADNQAAKMLLSGKLGTQAIRPSLLPTPGPGGVPDYFGEAPNWAFSPPLRKFVDSLPGLDEAGANNLGQYIPIGKPDTVTYPGCDYYEIELRQYGEKMHSDLPTTTLRGYVQVNEGTDGNGQNTLAPSPIHYLGPIIQATKDRPVRIKFTNKLPTGEAGDLFLPVDTTVMGAGMGPLGMDVPAGQPMNYTENRATLHLHGGKSPWISDGTAHQWITPAGENTPYPKGVSVQNVPDMPDPGPGSMTFYYSNQQSARMMFYHDHSWGITRLNVYAGEAAGYLLTDDTEQKLVGDGVIPADQIPLVIQDRTFVDASTITTTDPTWNWGTTAPVAHTGDLWYPHVYMPAQNPGDVSGVAAKGRWHYGPWFWPPTTDIAHGPVPNPYYDPINAPWEPELAPGVPDVSMPGEAFMDTPIVNGTAFPFLEVQPQSYRFRVLNAADDRFFNLQLYEADLTTTSADGRSGTEVKMVPASSSATNFPDTWPMDGRVGGVPDPLTVGPDFIQIASEGGFLPKPAVVKSQPVAWNLDPTTFNFGNVSDHALLLGPAERADVVIDFSKYAGKTLILYNDAPAAFPAYDARYDYYSGAPDLTETGGHPGSKVGFGPNTRTIMQVKVGTETPAPAFDMAKLESAFASTASTQGVFAESQDPVIIPTAEYDSAYATAFPADAYARIFSNSMTFKTVAGTTTSRGLEPKAIQDEMGEAFDSEYGRMSGKLGVELPNTNAQNQNFVLQAFVDKPTEVLNDSITPMSPVDGDGTQLWKITHNGVDTHPIHFHLFDVQLINRVGWDGAIRPPDANELGWKDTVRVSPLEDTIVALRPTAPRQPFGLPESVRPLNPAEPLGSTMGFTNVDPKTGQPITPAITNTLFNFGWEYTWHCHILAHEEMDMMRPISFNYVSKVPTAPVLTGSRDATGVGLDWTDSTPKGSPSTLGDPANEIGFRVERATVGNGGRLSAYSVIATTLANAVAYHDGTAASNTSYSYRVTAFNAAGTARSNALAVGLPGTTGIAVRLFGPDRYSTAIAAARDVFPNWGAVRDIVIVSGADPMVDALPAAGLGNAYNAPVLLCPPTGVPTSVCDAIDAAGTTGNVKLHLVGNTLNTGARNQLLAIPGVDPTLDVVFGSDRYGTSQAVALRMRTVLGPRTSVLFANGESSSSFYDGAAASAIAAGKGVPVLLVRRESVPANTLSTVNTIGATDRYVIGSTMVIENTVRTALGVPATNRWFGADRYATAAAVADNATAKGWLGKSVVGIASSIPDAISGGAATGAKGGVMLLTRPTSLPAPTRNYLAANKATITDCTVYGSTLAVSDTVVAEVDAALR